MKTNWKIIIGYVFVATVVPFIIHFAYNTKHPKIITDWGATEVFAYFGIVLSGLVTLIVSDIRTRKKNRQYDEKPRERDIKHREQQRYDDRKARMNILGRQLVANFLNLILTNAPKQATALLLRISTYKTIDLSVPGLTVLEDRNKISKINGERFDHIIGEFPFGKLPGLNGKDVCYDYIQTSLQMLNDDGNAFFIALPDILTSPYGKRFLNELSAKQFFCNSVFELPEKIYPDISITPIILQFERQKRDKLFIAKITDDCDTLFDSFNKRVSTRFLESGILVERESFKSFSRFKVECEIDGLRTQYNEYDKCRLKDVATKCDLVHSTDTDKSNCIYIPIIGQQLVTADIVSINSNPRNFLRIALNPERVHAQYLALFFRSELGKQVLQLLRSGAMLPRINRTDIMECLIPIPPRKEQELIVQASQKLLKQQETIEQLKAELNLNPKNANEILNKLENEVGNVNECKNRLTPASHLEEEQNLFTRMNKWLSDYRETIEQLKTELGLSPKSAEMILNKNGGKPDDIKQRSNEDRINRLIRMREGRQLEFKEKFSKDDKTGEINEKKVLKTIVAFLNTDGGTLLIGISNDGILVGADVGSSTVEDLDKYVLRFGNFIETKIGLEFSGHIDYLIVDVDGHHVLMVECKPYKDPCYYKEENTKMFYIRCGASTKPILDNDEKDRYIKNYLKSDFDDRYDNWYLHKYGKHSHEVGVS